MLLLKYIPGLGNYNNYFNWGILGTSEKIESMGFTVTSPVSESMTLGTELYSSSTAFRISLILSSIAMLSLV